MADNKTESATLPNRFRAWLMLLTAPFALFALLNDGGGEGGDSDAGDDSGGDDDAGSKSGNGNAGDDVPDKVKEILAKERKSARDAEKRARDAEARIKEFEDRDKSESEKLAERAAQAEKDAAESNTRYLRLKVGSAKGLAPELAERLVGTTEEEMAADADRLLGVLKPNGGGGSFDNGARDKGGSGGRDLNKVLREAATGATQH